MKTMDKTIAVTMNDVPDSITGTNSTNTLNTLASTGILTTNSFYDPNYNSAWTITNVYRDDKIRFYTNLMELMDMDENTQAKYAKLLEAVDEETFLMFKELFQIDFQKYVKSIKGE